MRIQKQLLLKIALLLSFTAHDGLSAQQEDKLPKLASLSTTVLRENPTTQPTLHHTEEPEGVTRISPSSWADLLPYLTRLIDETIATPAIEVRRFCFQVTREDWSRYFDWEHSLFARFKYPFSVNSANVGTEGDRVNGVYKIYQKQLVIHNYTRREETARSVNEYRFFGQKQDESLLNKKTFFNLMARVGFTEDDFKEGSTGIQGRILVKPIQLKSLTLAECKEELEGILGPTLQRSPEQFITFVFNLPPEAKFTTKDVPGFEGGIIGAQFREFRNLATIYEYDENRIYLCYENDRRKMLDLHGYEKDGKYNGITKEGALKLVRDYLRVQYSSFQNECTICTGKGNHAGANGAKGVLHAAFAQWMRDETIKQLVERTVPIMGDGGFKVFLKKPVLCDLTGPIPDPLPSVLGLLQRVIAEKGDRMLIRTPDKDFDKKLIRLLIMNRVPFPAISFERGDDELRLTLSYQADEALTSQDSQSEKISPANASAIPTSGPTLAPEYHLMPAPAKLEAKPVPPQSQKHPAKPRAPKPKAKPSAPKPQAKPVPAQAKQQPAKPSKKKRAKPAAAKPLGKPTPVQAKPSPKKAATSTDNPTV